MATRTPARSLFWTFVVASVAALMVSLDNLVVTTALPSIRADLGSGLDGLEWTVNGYTLSFAVFLLTGAALGDRFGRRRMFLIGLTIFTASSALAAVSGSIGLLVAARALQGFGAAIVLPLTLTILSAAVPPERRGAALGVWGAMSGLGVALGPLVGGAVTQGISWQWIFWVNVPIGLVLLPIAALRLPETSGPSRTLDLRGVMLASAGLFGLVFGLVRGNAHGWSSAGVLGPVATGVLLLGGFVAWERSTATPVLPLRLFRSRGFAATNVVALLMSFGMFGSVFLLAQFLQTVQGYSPLEAGLRTLPWTAMPVLVAPIAGPLSDRIGSRPLLVLGLVMQAVGLGWMAIITTTTVSFGALVPPFVLSGVGMALFFVPVASAVLGSVPADEQGVASGANNTLRELGGVFGVAVLASVFSSAGGFASGAAFVDGLRPALAVGAAVVTVGAVAGLFVPGRAAAPAPLIPEQATSYDSNPSAMAATAATADSTRMAGRA